jgi:hypothetical protein
VGTEPNVRVVSNRRMSDLLDLVRRFAHDLDSVELTHIDGEFLWLWCFPEVLPILEELKSIHAIGPWLYRDELEADQLGIVNAPPIEGRPRWWPFRDEASACMYHRYLDLNHDAAKIIPATVVGAILNGLPVTLRPMNIIFNQDFKDGRLFYSVSVLVYSSAATGADVEQALDQAVQEFAIELAKSKHPSFHNVRASFFPVFNVEQLQPLVSSPIALGVRLPCIAVHVPLPWYSRGGVGREYDVVVRSEQKWHLLLPDAEATRQDKEVALRTWGVGLLCGMGQRFGPAMRRVCEAGHLLEVSQTRFGTDRKKLIQRVPEAEPFLMQRHRTPQTLQTA